MKYDFDDDINRQTDDISSYLHVLKGQFQNFHTTYNFNVTFDKNIIKENLILTDNDKMHNVIFDHTTERIRLENVIQSDESDEDFSDLD